MIKKNTADFLKAEQACFIPSAKLDKSCSKVGVTWRGGSVVMRSLYPKLLAFRAKENVLEQIQS